jgi:dihydroorotate dehydrogenase electron transfer subunit
VQVTLRVKAQLDVAPASRVVVLESGDREAGARELPPSLPGQFVHLALGDGFAPYLRRPFSILGHERTADGRTRLAIMYAVVGVGTERLAAMREGAPVDLLGPLGNGFAPPDGGRWILVAGGRGAAPLYRLLETLQGGAAVHFGPPPRPSALRFLFGARTREHLWDLERLDGVPHELATDDGSAGRRGTVIDLLEAELARSEATPSPPSTPSPPPDALPPVVLACGPEPMLAAVAGVAARAGVTAQVSLESRMGCACGLCRGCVIPRRIGRDAPWPRDGNATYATVCKEGPVFLGDEVDWDAVPEI